MDVNYKMQAAVISEGRQGKGQERANTGRFNTTDNVLVFKLDNRFIDILITYITFYVSYMLLIYQIPHDKHIT